VESLHFVGTRSRSGFTPGLATAPRGSSPEARKAGDGHAPALAIWEQPRPAQQRLRWLERLAVLGRVPAEPGTRMPHVRSQISL
jgi:hypothetical protein